MNDILNIASKNQEKAWKIIKDTGIVNLWKSIGAEINIVGSLEEWD